MKNNFTNIYPIDVITNDDSSNDELLNDELSDNINISDIILYRLYCKRCIKIMLYILILLIIFVGIVWFLVNEITNMYRIPRIKLTSNNTN